MPFWLWGPAVSSSLALEQGRGHILPSICFFTCFCAGLSAQKKDSAPLVGESGWLSPHRPVWQTGLLSPTSLIVPGRASGCQVLF